MAVTRGVRMETETIDQLHRLTRALGRTQAELLRIYVARAYRETLDHPKYGSMLRMVEQMEAEEARQPKPVKARGAVIRLDSQEAKALRQKAYEETGDPGNATHLAKEAIRERLLSGEEKVQ